MSEPQPKSNVQTLLFIIILSFVCALILSVLASALAEPKEVAKDLDRSKQMMIAAKILNHEGHLLKVSPEGSLIPETAVATREQLLDVYKKRFRSILVDEKGEMIPFEQANIDFDTYVEDHRKLGFYKQPFKLLYEILPESGEGEPEGYVIPVNGFGLWDAIYGYLALKTDGMSVIGISWYDQKETPGLGANIADAPWQSLFPGKRIFQESPGGTKDLKTAPLGIVVVKGKVQDVYGQSPKAKSAVDGMAGATLTGNGVTDAYREVLAAYRPFLMKLNKNFKG